MSGIAASSLIVLAPVATGAEERLREALAALADGQLSPFARLDGTHFARWVLTQGLPGPDGRPVDAQRSYLLLCADFDPTPLEWCGALCDRAGDALGPVMSCWEAFPGLEDPGAVAEFLLARNAAAGFTVAGYRRCTVPEVRGALRLRRELRALAVSAQQERLSGVELFERWKGLGR